MIISKLRYCFTFCGLDYKFINKQLIRMEYFDVKTKRSYSERVIKQTANGYYLQGLYVNIDSIRRIISLKEVDEYVVDECPF